MVKLATVEIPSIALTGQLATWDSWQLGTDGVRAKGRGQTHRELLERGVVSHQEALEVRIGPAVTEGAAFLLSGEAGMCGQPQEEVEISSH